MPMNRAQVKATTRQNVRLVPVEPQVKSPETRELFNVDAGTPAQIGKVVDPTCYTSSSSMEDDMQKRYAVEYLSWERAKNFIIAAGEDPDVASIWDYCDESDISVYRKFPTKAAAFKWAKANADRDIFNMPRVREDSYVPVTDDNANPAGFDWERTGYWEVDGEDIEEIAA